MYLRANRRFKDGKEHRSWSVEESRRLPSGRVVQRRVLYLGEINDSPQAAWRKTLEVFDETEQRARRLSLFPEGREVPADALDTVQVKLAEMEVRRARAFGNYWLGCELWEQWGRGAFGEARLARGREEVAWAKVLELLVVSRRVSPGSELRLHRQGFDQSALGDLLGAGFAVAEKDRLYRCLDRIVEHKAALFDPLRRRWQDLFQARFDVLLYDRRSTYIEGEGEEIPQAKYGYSRDQRFDCRQVVIALVLTPEGFPLAYEVMEGNPSDRTTLRGFLAKIEAQYGRARRVWMRDRGIPTEEVLEERRAPEREVFYRVGAQHPGDLLHGLQAAPHRPAGPGVEKCPGPSHRSVLPKMSKGLLQLPRPGGLQLAGQQRVELLPGSPAYSAAPAQQSPSRVLELLCSRLARGSQAHALRPPHLVHRLVQMQGNVETVQDVQRLSGLRRDDLQVRFPHVTANVVQALDNPRPQLLQSLPQRPLRPPLTHKQQPSAVRVNLVQDGQEVARTQPVTPVYFVHADRFHPL